MYANGTSADLSRAQIGDQVTVIVELTDSIDSYFKIKLRECRLESHNGSVSIRIIQNFIVPEEMNWFVAIKEQEYRNQVQFQLYFFECSQSPLGMTHTV